MATRRATPWLLALAGACGPARPPAAPGSSASAPLPVEVHTATPELAPQEPDPVVRRLAARAVYHDDFARATLYSWTTPEQAAALRASRQLLVAHAESGAGPTDFNRALAEVAGRGGAAGDLARALLDRPELRRRRYAWTSPMATTLGLGPRRYGDVLIGVELDPRALVVRFAPAAPEPFAAAALDGRPVDLAAALAEPGRIAAVYHVREGPRELIAYREYVICNESMVARWSLATPELAALVAEELELVESLRTGPFAHVPAAAVGLPAAPTWWTAPPDPSLIDRWHASLAFDSPRYRPSPRNLAAIAAALRGYIAAGEPLVHRPASAPRDEQPG